MAVVDQLFSNPDVVATLVTTVAAFIGFLVRKAAKTEQARKNVDLGIELAYSIVTNEKLLGRVQNLDKAKLGLEKLREYLATYGQEPTASDLARARLVFAAKHGEEKAAP